MEILSKIHDTFIDAANSGLSYTTIILNTLAASSLALTVKGTTETLQLIGAGCLAFTAIMSVVLNRKRYWKGLRELFLGCPDDEIQEK